MEFSLPVQGRHGTRVSAKHATRELYRIAASQASDDGPSSQHFIKFDEFGVVGMKITEVHEMEPDIAFVRLQGDDTATLFARYQIKHLPPTVPFYSWPRSHGGQSPYELRIALRLVAAPHGWWFSRGACRLARDRVDVEELVNAANHGQVVRNAVVLATPGGVHAKWNSSMVTLYTSGPLYEALGVVARKRVAGF